MAFRGAKQQPSVTCILHTLIFQFKSLHQLTGTELDDGQSFVDFSGLTLYLLAK